VDDPLNTRLIEDVLAKLNQFGTGLVGRGAMLGFNASFFAEKNPVADLAAGKITFTVTLLPAREASNIVIDLIIDLNLFGTL
jgi:phage tail sheath protein FI